MRRPRKLKRGRSPPTAGARSAFFIGAIFIPALFYRRRANQTNFLGLFLRVFGWKYFSITVVEAALRARPCKDLFTREALRAVSCSISTST